MHDDEEAIREPGYPAEVDAALVDRARGGDLGAFEEIVRRYERRIRAVLARMLADERDVDEAAQDTFVQAWRSLERYRGDAALATWLHRIAVNEALQRLRRKALPTVPLDVPSESGEGPLLPSSWRLAVDLAVEDRELAGFLRERLRALPPELRAPVVLRDVEGWSNQEVADALGLTLAAAKSRIHRGRMLLRAELGRWLAARG